MAKEIERKFLTKKGIDWNLLGEKCLYKQGYLPTTSNTAVRIRIMEAKAFLTIKGESKGSVRSEFEYEIPLEDGENMLAELCVRPFIEKTRYKINVNGLCWEVDVFEGENKGLVIAEIELDTENQKIILPEWVTIEVTEDVKYYNSNLVKNPFKNW